MSCCTQIFLWGGVVQNAPLGRGVSFAAGSCSRGCPAGGGVGSGSSRSREERLGLAPGRAKGAVETWILDVPGRAPPPPPRTGRVAEQDPWARSGVKAAGASPEPPLGLQSVAIFSPPLPVLCSRNLGGCAPPQLSGWLPRRGVWGTLWAFFLPYQILKGNGRGRQLPAPMQRLCGAKQGGDLQQRETAPMLFKTLAGGNRKAYDDSFYVYDAHS